MPNPKLPRRPRRDKGRPRTPAVWHDANGKKTGAYLSWEAMVARCTNPAHTYFKNYGGRGIRICHRWLERFENFLADMGERPSGTTLDRIDCNGDYEPINCRWATRSEQARNRRETVLIHAFGESLPIWEWAKRVRIHANLIRLRIRERGWDPERALTQKVKVRKRHRNHG